MKIKKIKSKKGKMLVKLDILVLILCLIITSIKLGYPISDIIVKNILLLIELKASLHAILMMFILLSLWVFTLLFTKCFWFIIIYLAYRIPRKRAIKKNIQYEVIDNIEYYRETFNNLTPAEISLISDLEIEPKKDISASILNLYQKGNIEFIENNIIVKNKNSLKSSELALIDMIEQRNFNSHNIENWKQECVKEALNNNYIKIKNSQKSKKSFFTVGRIMLILFVLWICSIVALDSDKLSINTDEDKFQTYFSKHSSEISESSFDNLSDLELLNFFKNDPELVEIYIYTLEVYTVPMCILFVICVFPVILFGCMCYSIFKRIFHHSSSQKYERTKSGKILVEQIAGIQKYIHDFSLLSEKNKECINIWEDFLIYAIVLEENETIIKDIFTYKNINFNILNNINELFLTTL